MVRKGSTRSSAAISRRRCKQVGNQAVTWEDKKFEDWQKPLFRRVDDGTMRHALPPVDTSWSTWPRPGFASDMCQSSRCHCVVCLPVTLWKRAAKPAPALNSLAVDSKLSFPAGMLKIESSCDGTRLVGLGRSPGSYYRTITFGRTWPSSGTWSLVEDFSTKGSGDHETTTTVCGCGRGDRHHHGRAAGRRRDPSRGGQRRHHVHRPPEPDQADRLDGAG